MSNTTVVKSLLSLDCYKHGAGAGTDTSMLPT